MRNMTCLSESTKHTRDLQIVLLSKMKNVTYFVFLSFADAIHWCCFSLNTKLGSTYKLKSLFRFFLAEIYFIYMYIFSLSRSLNKFQF